MNHSIKDFYIDYQSTYGYPPQEEEWLSYYDSLLDQVEQEQDDERGK